MSSLSRLSLGIRRLVVLLVVAMVGAVLLPVEDAAAAVTIHIVDQNIEKDEDGGQPGDVNGLRQQVTAENPLIVAAQEVCADIGLVSWLQNRGYVVGQYQGTRMTVVARARTAPSSTWLPQRGSRSTERRTSSPTMFR